jgi:hypothetical protein
MVYYIYLDKIISIARGRADDFNGVSRPMGHSWAMLKRVHSALALVLAVGVGCIAVGVSITLSLLSAPARAGEPVLVLAPPWGLGVERIVQKTGGHLIGPDVARFGALAVFSGPIPVDDLTNLGSWLLADGNRIAQICGVTNRV